MLYHILFDVNLQKHLRAKHSPDSWHPLLFQLLNLGLQIDI